LVVNENRGCGRKKRGQKCAGYIRGEQQCEPEKKEEPQASIDQRVQAEHRRTGVAGNVHDRRDREFMQRRIHGGDGSGISGFPIVWELMIERERFGVPQVEAVVDESQRQGIPVRLRPSMHMGREIPQMFQMEEQAQCENGSGHKQVPEVLVPAVHGHGLPFLPLLLAFLRLQRIGRHGLKSFAVTQNVAG
jgi:hypothetical protein